MKIETGDIYSDDSGEFGQDYLAYDQFTEPASCEVEVVHVHEGRAEKSGIPWVKFVLQSKDYQKEFWYYINLNDDGTPLSKKKDGTETSWYRTLLTRLIAACDYPSVKYWEADPPRKPLNDFKWENLLGRHCWLSISWGRGNYSNKLQLKSIKSPKRHFTKDTRPKSVSAGDEVPF